jgi:peptide/nickel transport system permease protein
VIPIFEEPQVFAGAPWVKGVNFEAVGRPSFYGAWLENTKELTMSHALLRRLGTGLLVLWAAFTLSFVLLQVLPGDAVLIKFQNPDLGLSPAQIAEMRVAYGADSPLWQQYFHTLLAMLRGDFGYSLQAGRAGQRADCQQPAGYPEPRPARLYTGGPAGVCAGLRLAPAGSALAEQYSAVSAGPVYLLPTFWLGIALIQLFLFQLRWIPVINPTPLQGLILPIVTVAIPISAPLAQILMRSWTRWRRSRLSPSPAPKG